MNRFYNESIRRAKKRSMRQPRKKRKTSQKMAENQNHKLGKLKKSVSLKTGSDLADKGTSHSLDTTALPLLPDKAMPGLLGDCVRAVCKTSEVHPSSALMGILSRFASHVSSPFIEYGGARHHCCINGVFVGNSPQSWRAMLFKDIDLIFDGIPNAVQKIQGNMLCGKSLIEPVRDNIPSYGPKGNASSVSNDKRLLFYEQEFRSALAHAKGPVNTLSQTISGLFNHGSASQNLKIGKISAQEAHVIVLAQTSCTNFSILRKEVEQSNGFASYFLWFLVDRPKEVPRPQGISDEELRHFQGLIANRIRGAEGLTLVKMTRQAKEMWDNRYSDLTKNVPGVVGVVVSRFEIQAIRLALLYAIVAGRKRIQTEDLRAAYALLQYARESACIIFNGEQQGDNYREKILCALNAAPNHELSRTQISGVFNRNAASADIDAALQRMTELEQVKIDQKESTTGRKKTIVRLISKQV